MNYDELSSLGKMAYARYNDPNPTITEAQLRSLTKLTDEEITCILGV